MIIYEKDIAEFQMETVARWFAVILILAIIGYFVIIRPLKDDLPYKCWTRLDKVLFQLLPTVFFLIPLIFFSNAAFDATKVLTTWKNENYLTVEGQIEDWREEEVWLNGEQHPVYDCTFCVGDVSFLPESRYSAKDKSAINTAFEDGATVKVYYVLSDGQSPWVLKIERID